MRVGVFFGEEDGKGREDGAVDEIDAIVVGREVTLHGIYGHLFEIAGVSGRIADWRKCACGDRDQYRGAAFGAEELGA